MDVPTYLALAGDLERRLSREPAGTRVASEHELAREHSVSRLTARAALAELEQRHVVRRRQGSGTFVARRYDVLIAPKETPTWSETVRRAGGTAFAEITSLESGYGPVTLGPDVLVMNRVGYVDGQPAVYKTSWLAEDLVPGLREALSRHDSLFDALTEAYGLRPVRKVLQAELTRPPAEVVEALDLPRNTEVIWISSSTDSKRVSRHIESTHAWMRTDVFRLAVTYLD